MNRVEVHAEEVPLPGWADSLAAFACTVLDTAGKTNWDLSILLCNDASIRALNSRYRALDEPTDVLSFSLGETVPDGEGCMRYLPGDLVISLETLEENARYFRVNKDEELRRLVIHGILHLDGMDHEDNEPFRPMLRLQEELLEKLSGKTVIEEGAALRREPLITGGMELKQL
ncbi:MAG: rRNA maturation RNase YbeY [Spirochaetaceae bacterium]|jgi:probable rRNA maturation factor|nr:rRNA maturation RNase YbeY [Spirochaetaceae bacterium]